MIRTAIVAMVFVAAPAQADMYKWVDSGGVVHYSDQPPPTPNADALKIVMRPASGSSTEVNPRTALPGRWTQAQGNADYLEMTFSPTGQLAARAKKNQDRLEFSGQWQANGRDLEMVIADGTVMNDSRGVQSIAHQRKVSQILEMSDSTLVLRDVKDGSVSRFSKTR